MCCLERTLNYIRMVHLTISTKGFFLGKSVGEIVSCEKGLLYINQISSVKASGGGSSMKDWYVLREYHLMPALNCPSINCPVPAW